MKDLLELPALRVPNLSDLPAPPVRPTGEMLRPLLTGNAAVDVTTAFRLIDNGKAQKTAYDYAAQAAGLQSADAPVLDVFRVLARAEGAAPPDTRPWHAARLDAWAEVYGIRGWHRFTSLRGGPTIAIDRLRLLSESGEVGRYFAHAAAYMHRPLNHWVVDRDSGRTVYRSFARGIAQQWIEEREIPAA